MKPVFAQTTDLETLIDQSNFFQTDIGEIIGAGLQAVLIVGSLLVLGYLIWGAIDWLTSEGDKEKYTAARNKIMHAIIGLVIIAVAYVIWKILIFFLGLSGEFLEK